MKKTKIKNIFYRLPVFILITAVLIIMQASFFAGCHAVPKYTYEEYRKIKAFNENKQTLEITDSQESLDDLELFYRDLEHYNTFISEFSAIYNKYSGLLFPLIDSFDAEQEDMDLKKQHASSMMDNYSQWLGEIKEMDVPGIVSSYHGFFKDYLEIEILFYENFLTGDALLSGKYQADANEMYDAVKYELESIESQLNQRAAELGIDQVFN
ncbi:MAG: hypothetical protein FJW68_01995 [Actinobacteria bacterium]|nr:hypothetical protein [Actinomycetota bacterium]